MLKLFNIRLVNCNISLSAAAKYLHTIALKVFKTLKLQMQKSLDFSRKSGKRLDRSSY